MQWSNYSYSSDMYYPCLKPDTTQLIISFNLLVKSNKNKTSKTGIKNLEGLHKT